MAMNFFSKKDGVNVEEITAILTQNNADLMQSFGKALGEKLESVVSVAVGRAITDILPKLSLPTPTTNDEVYVTEDLNGLIDEKKSSEIIAMLFAKMKKPHPSSLRPFYTEVEKRFKIALSQVHKERVANVTNKGDGKYPYRKMDTALQVIEESELYSFAKTYVFKTN